MHLKPACREAWNEACERCIEIAEYSVDVLNYDELTERVDDYLIDREQSILKYDERVDG